MRKTREDKKKAKRKIKQKEFRRSMSALSQVDKADFLFRDAIWYWDSGRLDKALPLLEKAVRLDAGNVEYLNELGKLGEALNRPEVELKALQSLHKKGRSNLTKSHTSAISYQREDPTNRRSHS